MEIKSKKLIITFKQLYEFISLSICFRTVNPNDEDKSQELSEFVDEKLAKDNLEASENAKTNENE